MSVRAVIFGCAGTVLSPKEKEFFNQASPWGFILFARNIENADQLRKLCADLRASVGRDAPILIDQEGGRVQRLVSPMARDWPAPLDQFDQVKENDRRQAMGLRHRIIAHELRGFGLDVNCAPMLDVPQENSHEIIKNRCFAYGPDDIAELGRAAAEGLLAGGVLPIIKHIPGHGRSPLDSHLELPVVDCDLDTLRKSDFVPFKRLADLPMAMSAHIVYPAIDPEHCATFSRKVISEIREFIGFDGLLMTDDLSMKALDGSFQSRVERALDAGCDMILHCNGLPEEMQEIAGATPKLEGDALRRAQAALAARLDPDPFDFDAACSQFDSLVKEAAYA